MEAKRGFSSLGLRALLQIDITLIFHSCLSLIIIIHIIAILISGLKPEWLRLNFLFLLVVPVKILENC